MNKELKAMFQTGFTIMALAGIQSHITGELSDKDIVRISKKIRKIVNEEINKK